MRPSSKPLALLASLALAGCMGSEVAYLPYDPEHDTREERPDPAHRADEEEQLALKSAVPVEVDRSEALYEQTRKAIGRTIASIPRNPWNQQRRDLVTVLGAEEAGKYLPTDPIKPVATPTTPTPKKEGEEGEAKPAEKSEE